MIVLSIEEFAAKRRKSQEDLEAALLAAVTAALKALLDGLADWSGELHDEIRQAYMDVLEGEGGSDDHGFAAFEKALDKALDKTTPESSATTIATWLATAILNAATSAAADQDDEFVVMEWVTMHDGDVRSAHEAAEGQQRPPGEPFNVGGEEMPYPGFPSENLSNWINCRCALAPAIPSEDFHVETVTAAGDCECSCCEAEACNCTTWPTNVHCHCTSCVAAIEAAVQTGDEPEGEVMAENEEVTIVAPWHGVLAPEGQWSGDGRQFAENSLTHRDLPLPLTWQKSSGEGHSGSVVVGRIDKIARVDGEMRGTGVMLQTPESDQISAQIAEFGKFGVSVDADDAEFEYDEETDKIVFTSARIASASIVAIPAFMQAWVALGDAPPGFMPDDDEEAVDVCDETSDDYDADACAARNSDSSDAAAAALAAGGKPAPALSLVAAGGWAAPSKFFKNPGLTEPTALTITDDGHVFGHAAEWTTCHIAYEGFCQTAPHSTIDYAAFLLGELPLDDGSSIAAGNLTIGGGHAPSGLRARAAAAHYDSTSSVFAYVTCGEDEFGIWFSGCLKPGLTPEQITEAKMSKISGDWRDMGNEELDMVAAHAVNTPGFPIPRIKIAAANGRQVSLVAAGIVQGTSPVETFDIEEWAEKVAVAIEKRAARKERVAALAARVGATEKED